jgi:hypothetical protein
VRLSPPLFGLLYRPRMIDDDECGAFGGMRTGRGNRSTWSKPAPMPLCPPQILHDLTWARTRVRRGGKPTTKRLSYEAADSKHKEDRSLVRRKCCVDICTTLQSCLCMQTLLFSPRGGVFFFNCGGWGEFALLGAAAQMGPLYHPHDSEYGAMEGW